MDLLAGNHVASRFLCRCWVRSSEIGHGHFFEEGQVQRTGVEGENIRIHARSFLEGWMMETPGLTDGLGVSQILLVTKEMHVSSAQNSLQPDAGLRLW